MSTVIPNGCAARTAHAGVTAPARTWWLPLLGGYSLSVTAKPGSAAKPAQLGPAEWGVLTTKGIRELVVCGIRTEQCVETTARLASDLGYQVTFVTDATATNPIEHRDAPPHRPLPEILADPRTLQVGEIIARTEYALAGRFAAIRSVEDMTRASPVRGRPSLALTLRATGLAR